MDCPYCGRPARVVQKLNEGGYVRMVRECTIPYGMEEEHGPRQFMTVEIPEPVFVTIGATKLNTALEKYKRGTKQRITSYGRKLAAERLRSLNGAQLARALGISRQHAWLLINERKAKENHGLQDLPAAGPSHGEDVPDGAREPAPLGAGPHH